MSIHRQSGKSYRAILQSLLLASSGSNVELVVYDRGAIRNTIEALVTVSDALSSLVVVSRDGHTIKMLNGSKIEITTMDHRLDPHSMRELETVLDIV